MHSCVPTSAGDLQLGLPIAQCSGERGPFILCLAYMGTEASVPLANSSQEHGDLFRMTPKSVSFFPGTNTDSLEIFSYFFSLLFNNDYY